MKRIELSTENAFAFLETALQKGLHVTAVVDPLADDSLIPTFFTMSPHLPYEMLFSHSPLEHALKVTPYVIGIDSLADPFCRHLSYSLGWGFFAVSSLPLQTSTAHWKSLLQIYSGDAVTHFRFYDTQIPYSLWSVFSEADAVDLLGPHLCLLLPSGLAEQPEDERRWAKLEHPFVAEPAAIADRYTCRKSPWWHLTDKHWSAFKEQLPVIVAYNIKEFLFETYPLEAGAQHARTNLDEFCLRHFLRAESLGIKERETAKHFVACCMLVGENFPEGTEISILPYAGQEAVLADKLRNLCEKAVNNG